MCGPKPSHPHPHSLLQIWVKPSNEMQFLYGNHVLKQGLGRITENTPAYTGVGWACNSEKAPACTVGQALGLSLPEGPQCSV